MYILHLQIRKLIDKFGSRVLWAILCCCILMCIIFLRKTGNQGMGWELRKYIHAIH